MAASAFGIEWKYKIRIIETGAVADVQWCLEFYSFGMNISMQQSAMLLPPVTYKYNNVSNV